MNPFRRKRPPRYVHEGRAPDFLVRVGPDGVTLVRLPLGSRLLGLLFGRRRTLPVPCIASFGIREGDTRVGLVVELHAVGEKKRVLAVRDPRGLVRALEAVTGLKEHDGLARMSG